MSTSTILNTQNVNQRSPFNIQHSPTKTKPISTISKIPPPKNSPNKTSPTPKIPPILKTQPSSSPPKTHTLSNTPNVRLLGRVPTLSNTKSKTTSTNTSVNKKDIKSMKIICESKFLYRVDIINDTKIEVYKMIKEEQISKKDGAHKTLYHFSKTPILSINSFENKYVGKSKDNYDTNLLIQTKNDTFYFISKSIKEFVFTGSKETKIKFINFDFNNKNLGIKKLACFIHFQHLLDPTKSRYYLPQESIKMQCSTIDKEMAPMSKRFNNNPYIFFYGYHLPENEANKHSNSLLNKELAKKYRSKTVDKGNE